MGVHMGAFWVHSLELLVLEGSKEGRSSGIAPLGHSHLLGDLHLLLLPLILLSDLPLLSLYKLQLLDVELLHT